MPAPETAPAPLFGSGDEVRAEWVAFEVTAHGQEVLFFLHGKRLESALLQVAAAWIVVVSVPALGMSQTEPADKPRQFPVLVRLESRNGS